LKKKIKIIQEYEAREIKIIQEYDARLAKEGKLNKTKFAVKTCITKSSLCNILDGKTRQWIEIADF